VEELDVEARLALHVENPGPRIAHRDERCLRVVLRHHFARLGGDADGEEASAGRGGGDAHAHGSHVAVRGERHVLRAHYAAAVLDHEGHRSSPEPALRDIDVDDERRALQHGTRRVHAAYLDVLREPLLSHADCGDTHPARVQRAQRLVQRASRSVVRSVAQEDQARERHPLELLARAFERGRETRR
jgi:hypothetical protein